MEAGTQLGPYEIVERLGAGGMGEVYRARDTRLDRDVALKILPAQFADSPERLARFEQEARAAAALNHPHIAAVHDVGHEAGVHYIVQEYLRGETLEQVIASGALGLERALELATEMGEALAAAHEAGIVHRDLKPANVFVTRQGHAKVLDFGLAKLVQAGPPGASDDGQTHSPTMLGTVAGQIMGTAGYMAPEQVEGGPVDARTDVFAFGCVLYEMVAGARAFAGRSVMQTLDLIVHEEPARLRARGDGLPRQLDWVLDKCLAKDPARRYQHAADLVVDLRRLAADVNAGVAEADPAGVSGPAEVPSTGVRGVSWSVAVGLAALAAVMAGVLVWWATSLPGSATLPPVRVDIALPPGVELSNTGRHAVAISRDGRTLAFSAGNQIWIRRLAEDVAIPLRGTEGGGRSPAFSPDGRDVVFWAEGELRRVPVSGGAHLRLAEADNPWGVHWEEDDRILYGQGPEGIWSVRASGGEAEQLLAVGDGAMAQSPQSLPDGRILYTLRDEGATTWDDSRIVVQEPGAAEAEMVVPAGRDARYVATGHLVYARGADLLGSPWSSDAGEVEPGRILVQGVASARGITGASHFDVSAQGDLVYLSGDEVREQERRFLWVDRGGHEEATALEPLRVEGFALSPSGDRVAVVLRQSVESDARSLWVYDLGRGAGQLLASAAASGDENMRGALWSEDGRWIYFAAGDPGTGSGIFRVPADRSGDPEELIREEGYLLGPEDLFPGREALLLVRQESTHFDPDLYRYSLTDGSMEPVVASGAVELAAELSPDGRFLAYTSSESGERRVYVRDLESGATVPVSVQAASRPRWSAAGDELFYLRQGSNGPDQMMAVEVSTDAGFRSGAPVALFPVDFVDDFQVASDDSRFLLAPLGGSTRISGEGDEPRIRLILGWARELAGRTRARF